MKKALVLIPFRDKRNRKIKHKVGEIVEFNTDRVAALAARGLVKTIEDTESGESDHPDMDTEKGKADKGKGKRNGKADKPAAGKSKVEETAKDGKEEDKE